MTSLSDPTRIKALAVGMVALLGACGGAGDGASLGTAAQQACDALSGQTIDGTTLVSQGVAARGTAPAYCKVNGMIAPKLIFEVRLPSPWNGKLYYGGGGGYNGTIPDVSDLNLAALTAGYATVNSDSGHQGDPLSAAFALNDPQAAALFGNLSVPSVMNVAVKVVKVAFGSAPSRSYFEGCSGGGREALMSVQRNPALFDGVIARAPGYNWAGFMGHFNRTARAVAASGGFSLAKTQLLARSVRNACDGLDGITDGVVSNQAACTTAVFDPASLRCAGGGDTGNSCLSDAQLAVVNSYTSDAVFAGSATYRNAGWSLTGNEDDPGAWPVWVTGNGVAAAALQGIFQDTTVKNYLAKNPAANSLAYAPWNQNAAALANLAALNDATQTDIRPFRDRGGKLLIWQGGSDPALSKNATIEYYNNVAAVVGGTANADAFTRLYIAPGVNHCTGGPGADTTDLLGALDRWVVSGIAPTALIAQQLDPATGAANFTRPLCQHPKYPRYIGPANDAQAAKLAANYACS